MTSSANLGGKRPLVTVLIDTYNYGHFIEEAIGSVLSQDFPAGEMEIIVVDDGSTDNTREVVAKHGERVHYFYKANSGQASAFNYGVERARGELIALLDADDYWLPSKLRRVVDAFQTGEGVGLVYHRLQKFHSTSAEWSVGEFNAVSGFVPSDIRSILLYTACQTSGLTFRADLLRKLLPLDQRMIISADALLAALIIFLGPVVAIDEPLAVYRIHGANLYFHGGQGVDPERQSRRIETLGVVLEGMDKWLVAHGYDLSQPAIQAFRQRWCSLYETEEFALRAPGRLRFFKHLRQTTKNMRPCLNRRIRTVNWINTMASLLVGYHRYGDLDRWRIDFKNNFLK